MNIINNKGFIRLIITIIVALLILSYFQIDIRNLWNSDITQGNFSAAWSFVQHVWYDYIKAPIVFVLSFILGLIQ